MSTAPSLPLPSNSLPVVNTCRRCKWWGRDFAGVCDAPQCDIEERVVNGFPPDVTLVARDEAGFGVHASADDDQGLEARLVTGPNFGCILFQPKEDTAKGTH